MRIFLIAAIAAFLVACSPQPAQDGQAQVAEAVAASVFPDLFQGAYRADATVTQQDGQTMSLAVIRDGQKARMEMITEQGPMAVVSNRATGESFMVMTMQGRTMVMRGANGGGEGPDLWWEEAAAEQMTPVGPCSHLGENGMEWSRTDADSGVQNACVTSDGIILWGTQNGRTTWQTTSIRRGAQDPTLFDVPEGAQDLSQLGAGLAEAMGQARGGGNR